MATLPAELLHTRDSEMARRVRELDWAATPLGPPAGWPRSLVIAVSICLNSRFPMFVWWGDELVNIYNDGYIPVLGKRHPDALGRPARSIWKEIWADVGPQAELVMQHGEATWNERVHLRMERHGYPEDTWFTWSYSPIRDEAGKVGGLFCACTEDTGRVLAERRRDELDNRFRALVSASSDAVYRMSADWSDMHYLQGRDFIADTSDPSRGWIEKYIPASDRKLVQDAIAHAIRTKSTFQLEHRVHRADGSIGWTFSRAVPILDDDGEIVEWFGAASDVTERRDSGRQLEEARATAERQHRLYEAILTNTPDLAYVWNLDHRFIYANEGLLRMWGKTWDEAIGRNCLELGYEPWHAAMHDREIDQIVATGKPLRGEVPFDGTFGRRIYDYILVPVFGPDGKVEAVAGTTRDVTEYREGERRKDEFIATLSHELRNPLAPLRNGLMVLRAGGASGSEVASVREMMERQVNHLVRLVDDLLEASRITRGTLALRRERVDIASVVRNAMETCAPMIQAARHRLAVAVPGEALWVDGDPVRLAQILSNVLNNAARYTPEGGEISLEAAREDGRAAVRIRDNGTGIEPGKLPRLFEMFSRGDGADTHAPGGLGIGLALARSLVEMHGGTIDATSEGPGKGSEFIVRLPLASGSAPARAAPAAGPLFSGRRVLIIDDNADAADSLALLLRTLGAEVRVATSGPDGLEAFAAYEPQAVLLDIGMPVMDGYEVARRIRAAATGSRPTLVALTGWGQEEHREKARDAGFDHHLVKPAEIGKLQELLAGVR